MNPRDPLNINLCKAFLEYDKDLYVLYCLIYLQCLTFPTEIDYVHNLIWIPTTGLALSAERR